MGVQSALNGATMANKKCASLGYELVKVFRMFTNKKTFKGLQDNSHIEKKSKGHKIPKSPIKRQQFDEGQDEDFHSQSTIDGAIECLQSTSKMSRDHHSLSERTNLSPQKFIKRKMCSSMRDALHTKTTYPSQIHKPSLHHEREQDNRDFCNFEESESPSKNKTNSLQSCIEPNECKLHGPCGIVDEEKTIVNTNIDGRLTIEKRQEGFTKNCQRTNIRLEAGRIHVNVSHRSSGLNQNLCEKRNDLIAVQS